MPLLLKNLLNNIFIDSSVKTGEQLESLVEREFFPTGLYELMQRTHNFRTKKESFGNYSTDPDFQFQIKGEKIKFWVECKHRDNINNNTSISVFKPGQLNRYRANYNSFLFLRTYFHDKPRLYFVPLYKISGDLLFISFLEPYELTMNPPVWPGLIKKYLP